MYKAFVVSLAIILFVSFETSRVKAAAETNKCISLFLEESGQFGAHRKQGKLVKPAIEDDQDTLIQRLLKEAQRAPQDLSLQIAVKLFQISHDLYVKYDGKIPERSKYTDAVRKIIQYYQLNILEIDRTFNENAVEIGSLRSKKGLQGKDASENEALLRLFKDEQNEKYNSVVELLLSAGFQHAIYNLTGRVGDTAIIEISGHPETVSRLLSMYGKLAHKMKWDAKHSAEDTNFVTLTIEGPHAFTLLSSESGEHDVTSKSRHGVNDQKANVVVYAPIKFNEVDQAAIIKMMKFEYMRSEGAGGQHVNKTESACRVTYVHEGQIITAKAQDHREQSKNREEAIKRVLGKIKAINDAKYNQIIRDTRQQSQAGIVREYPFQRDSRLAKNLLDGNIEGILVEQLTLQEIQSLEEFLSQIRNLKLF